MHIKSMVIDGFKSYGQRTEIEGFDIEFNAITGLNGSGKSNILDAYGIAAERSQYRKTKDSGPIRCSQISKRSRSAEPNLVIFEHLDEK